MKRVSQGAAIDALGNLEFNVDVPGFEDGLHTFEVQVGDRTVSQQFYMINRGYIGDPHPSSRGQILRGKLEDNFVRAFHFSKYDNEWQFYDLGLEGWDKDYWHHNEGSLHFLDGLCYWILVKEPTEVELGGQLRSLTCRPDGNCWNRLIW